MKTMSRLGVQISWLVFIVMVSCQKENVNNPTSTQAQMEVTAKDNSQMIAVAQDAMDATGVALGAKGISNGRYSANQQSGDQDMRMSCQPSISGTFSIDKSHTDTLIYSGSLAI